MPPDGEHPCLQKETHINEMFRERCTDGILLVLLQFDSLYIEPT